MNTNDPKPIHAPPPSNTAPAESTGVAPHLAAQRRWRAATHHAFGIQFDSVYMPIAVGAIEAGATVGDMFFSITGGFDDEDVVIALAAWLAEDLVALSDEVGPIPGLGHLGDRAARCQRKAAVLVEMMRQQRAALAPLVEAGEVRCATTEGTVAL
jgi:hypothetical protein